MTDSDPTLIIDRISAGTHTPADLALLQQLLSQGDGQSVLNLGKYNVNIGQGQDIQIGDRVFVEWNDAAIQALLEVIRKELIAQQQTGRVRMAANPPRSGVANLVGRDRELTTLHDLLQEGDRVVSIAGMGGVGKSELAVQYAKRRKNDYPGGIYWLRARSGDLAAQILTTADLPAGIDVPQTLNDRPLSLIEQVQWCWDHWQTSATVLIVIDDVVDASELQDLLPTDSRFRVMLTTRTRGLDASFEELPLEVLLPNAGLQLLQQLLGRSDRRIERSPETAVTLCERLGYLPLGLELVGRYLGRDRALSLSMMLDRLKAQRIEEVSLDRALQYQMTARLGVKAAFELTWEQLEPATQTVTLLLSFFAAAAIPWNLVEAMMQQSQSETSAIDQARMQLDNTHLIKPVDDTFTIYTIHPLIREFLQTKRTGTEQPFQQAFIDVLIAEAKQMPQTPVRQEIDAFKVIVPHLKVVAVEMLTYLNDEDLFGVFGGVARFYQGQGLYKLAEPWFQQCLEATQTRFGNDHPHVAASLNNLAGLYQSQGRYSEAEPLYTRSLSIMEQQLGAEHPDVATSLNNLAELYQSQGRYSEAEPLYVRSFSIMEQQLGANHPHVAASLNNLAGLYQSQGRYSEAEPLYERSLSIREQQLGADHPDVATSLNNLAGLYESQGRYSEAEPLYERSLSIREQQLGADHPHVASSLNNLAGLYQSQGRYSETEPLYGRSFSIMEQQLGADHPHVASSLNNLAELYRSQGRYSEAEPLYGRSLSISEQQLGADHPDVAQSLNNLALLYQSQGHYSEAEPLYTRSLSIREQQLGAEHPDVAQSLNNLAALYQSQGHYSEAEPLYTRSLSIREQQLGAEHPDVAQSLNNLAALYYSQGRYSETEPLYERSLSIREQQLGADHPDVAASLNNLAGLYYSQGCYSEAEPLYERSLSIMEQQLGADHPDTASSLFNMAALYCNTARYSQALLLIQRAVQIYEQTLTSDHPTTQAAYSWLRTIREAVGE